MPVHGKRYARTNIVAGLLSGKIVGEMLYQTTMNAELFEPYFENIFMPSIPKDSVVIMDNATFHRKSILKEIVRRFDCHIIFYQATRPT